MTNFDQISATVEDTDGVLLIIAGKDDKFQVNLLKPGILTEANIERHMPLIFHEVMRQRMQNVVLPAGRQSVPHATIAEPSEDDEE